MEIAIFGGSFNPPTVAHEAIIEACLADRRIDQVWLLPSGERTDKPDLVEDELRLGMLGLLKQARFASDPRLHVSDFELRLERPTRTQRTAAALAEAYPDEHFNYVYGADAYLDMPNWEGGTDLQKHLGLLLIERPGYELPSEDERIHHLRVDTEVDMSISSTLVRTAIAAGKLVTGTICEAVNDYIVERGLYIASTGVNVV